MEKLQSRIHAAKTRNRHDAEAHRIIDGTADQDG
jgi:hypothetical protein